MKQRGLLTALGLLLLVNVIVLGGVSYNRSGEDAVMTLTERELPVASGYAYQENSGLSLRINTYHRFYWTGKAGNYDEFRWLDSKKLESLGFSFDPRVTSGEKNDYYDRQLPRQTFAVVEFDGAAWTAWKKILEDELASLGQEGQDGKKTDKERESARHGIERELKAGSRLFIVDAGKDPALLRQQYTDRSRYLILPATARVSYWGGYAYPEAKSSIRGHISLLIDEMNVSHHLHTLFDGRQPQKGFNKYPPITSEGDPRYEVSLRSGKRYEPWIENIERRQVQ